MNRLSDSPEQAKNRIWAMMIRKALQTATLILGTLVTPASATTIVDFLGNDPVMGMDVTFQADGNQVTWFAGFTNLIADGLSHETAFCIDAFTEIWNGQHMMVISDPSSLSNGARAAWLMQNMMGTVSTAVQAAGMQIAVWDIIHDAGDGLGFGRIQGLPATDAAVALAATQFIDSSAGKSSLNAYVYSSAPGHGPVQALMSCGPNGCDPSTATPEPGSLFTAALGAAAIGIGAWRRNRR